MSESGTDTSKRNYPLDAVRGGALMLVLWFHVGLMPDAERARIGALAIIHDVVMRVGWASMDCFFAMSGFLVGGLLFSAYARRGTLGVGRFYFRRGLKIYPAFYLLWVLTLLLGPRIEVLVTARRAAVEALFIQNLTPGLWIHTWSLGLEEQFYILLPLVLLVALRFSHGRADRFAAVPWVYLLVLAGVEAARIVTAVRLPGWSFYTHFSATYLRIDEPMVGVACAYWFHFHRESLQRWVSTRRWVFWVVGAIGAAVPVCFDLRGRFVLVAGYSLVAIGFAAVMMLMVLPKGAAAPGRTVRGLAYIGRHSYSIYVWHQPVRWVGVAIIKAAAGREATFWEAGALVFPVAIVVGIGMAHLIEFPALRLRNRVAPSTSGDILDARAGTS